MGILQLFVSLLRCALHDVSRIQSGATEPVNLHDKQGGERARSAAPYLTRHVAAVKILIENLSHGCRLWSRLLRGSKDLAPTTAPPTPRPTLWCGPGPSADGAEWYANHGRCWHWTELKMGEDQTVARRAALKPPFSSLAPPPNTTTITTTHTVRCRQSCIQKSRWIMWCCC